ncbi:MAG: ParB/RepB/Spo0J family partition protein [Dehalococcoidia bacterium]
MARKDIAAMERDRPSGLRAAREAMRSRMAHPTRLNLDELQPNPRNPRYPDDDPEVRELADTMARVGQLQPALVITRDQYESAYPGDEIGSEPWVVVVGNRRLAASRLAGRSTLDVRVVEELPSSGAEEAIEDRVLIENVQRQDLPPLLEAAMLQRRLDRPGETLRSVAAAIGKTHTYVAQRTALLKLVPELQEMLREGRLGIRQARVLGIRAAEEQRSVADQIRTMEDDEAHEFLAGIGRSSTDRAGDAGEQAAGRAAPAAAEGAADGNPVSTDGGEVAQPQDDDRERGAAGNRVSSRNRSGAARNRAGDSGAGPDLEATRLSVQQWLDNAAGALDKVLPAGGDAGIGGQLAEVRQFIEKARAVLGQPDTA